MRLSREPLVMLAKVDGPSLISSKPIVVDDDVPGSLSLSRELSAESNQLFSPQSETNVPELSQSTPYRSFSPQIQSSESGHVHVQVQATQKETHERPQRRATRRQMSPGRPSTRSSRSKRVRTSLGNTQNELSRHTTYS